MANSDERAGQPESMEQVIALYYDQIYKFCYWKTPVSYTHLRAHETA